MPAGIGLSEKDLALYGFEAKQFEPLGDDLFFVPHASAAWEVITQRPCWQWKSADGRTCISGRVRLPGYKGYMLYVDGQHVSTHKLYREARAAAQNTGSKP